MQFNKRSMDPDQQRVELNKLKRREKQEKRGAMRELRRDAAFVAQAKAKEKQEKDDARKKVHHENAVWMQRFEASYKEQVKAGGGLMKPKAHPKKAKARGGGGAE